MLNRRTLFAASMLPLWSCSSKPEVQGGFIGPDHIRGHSIKSLTSQKLSGKTTKNIKIETLILGGGVSGLSAARALLQKGKDDFAVLELEDEVGGNSRATQMAGLDCPIGAHYLPVPGDAAYEVQDYLEEIGIRQRKAGRWTIDEKYLCHSPQERLFINGHWQEGLLPVDGISRNTHEQYLKFKKLIDSERKETNWLIPIRKKQSQHRFRYLASINFSNYLNSNNLNDKYLLWYLNYCCLDEYGADIFRVSAWAGIHYFASRHGFSIPGKDNEINEGLLTWPEGNAWLIHKLVDKCKDHIYTGQLALKIEKNKHNVQVYVMNTLNQSIDCWHAKHVIVAIPIFVAARVIENPMPLLRKLNNTIDYAPWMVANIYINNRLNDINGAALSWDNVVYESKALGYVNASHQNLFQKRSDTVLTHYRALGYSNTPSVQRQWLLQQPWSYWRDTIFFEFSVCHPDLIEKTKRIDIARYGHAMAIPAPNNAGNLGYSLQERTDGRITFAHSDWVGYSIFEEAFTLGFEAGNSV